MSEGLLKGVLLSLCLIGTSASASAETTKGALKDFWSNRHMVDRL